MTDTPETLPTDLKEMIESNRKLAALIEPLQMMLALDRSPGMSERLEAFMSELSAIREQMQRAADTMERTLAHRDDELAQQARLHRGLNQVQAYLAELKAWFGAPRTEVLQSS